MNNIKGNKKFNSLDSTFYSKLKSDFIGNEIKTVKIGDLVEETKFKNTNFETDNVLSVSKKGSIVKKVLSNNNKHDFKKDFSLYKIISKNDFAYNPIWIHTGAIGRCENENRGLISDSYVSFVIKNFNLITNDFLSHFFKSRLFNTILKQNTNVSVRNSLGFKEFSKFNINLPSIEHQEEISKFLNFILSLEEKTNLIELKLKKLFNTYNNFVFNSLIKKQDLYVPINELVEVFSRYNITRKFYIRYSAGVDGIKIQNKIKDLPAFINYAKGVSKIISYNDFAFNPWTIQKGILGQSKFKNDGLISPDYTTFKIKENIDINHDYFIYLFRTNKFIDKLKKSSRGSARLRLNKEEFKKIEIPVPSIKKQNEIANILNKMQEIIEINKKIADNISLLKKFLYGIFFR